MTEKQRDVVVTSLVIGCLVRMFYVFVLHRASDHVYSDMQGYVEWALRYFGPQPQSIADTVHAPGTPMYYAVLHALDPAWNLAMMVQWCLSVGSLLLLWRIASLCYGGWVGPLVMAFGAVYFPYVHYAGFFLAENPFIFCLLAGFWAMVHADRARSASGAMAWAIAAGLACGVAASFKNAVLGAVAITGTGYAILAIRQHRRTWLAIAAGTLVGMAALYIPMTVRCTNLTGHVCLAASNTGMNMLIGHYGKKGMFYWEDRQRNITFAFQSPSTVLRGYTEPVHFPFGAYDSEQNFRTLAGYLQQHPGEALGLSLDNVWDLFATRTMWPGSVYWGTDVGEVFQHIYWFGILAPGLLYIAVCASRRTQYRIGTYEVMLLLPLLGIMTTVFLSVSEVRYRVPFDGFMIVLAARAYTVLASEVLVRIKQRRARRLSAAA